MKSVLSVTVVQESQRVTVSDSQTDSAENVDNSEQLQTPTAAQLHNETTTGNRFRHHVTSIVAGSACGCWSEQLERRLVRTVSRVCETLERAERRQKNEQLHTANRVAWQYVSLVVDRLLLMIFTVGTITITLGVLFSAPLSSNFIFGPPDTDVFNKATG